MKKIWFAGLAAGILGLLLTVSAGAEIPFVLGDLTGDGNVTAEDSAVLNRYFAGHYTGKIPFDIDKADVDGDGYLTRRDGMRLARYADGWKGYEISSKTTGFTVEPHIENSEICYETDCAGEVWYFYAKSELSLTAEEFEEEYGDAKYTGIENVSADTPEGFEIRDSILDDYPYLVIAFLPEGEDVFCSPVVLDVGTILPQTEDDGLVLYLSGSINAGYSDDSYLLGATEYEIVVFDLLEGKPDITVLSSNSKVKAGSVYRTAEGVITEDTGIDNGDFDEILEEAADIYPDSDDDAVYLFGKFTMNENNAALFFGEGTEMTAEEWLGTKAAITPYQKGLVYRDTGDEGDTTANSYEGLSDLRGDSVYNQEILNSIRCYMVKFSDEAQTDIKDVKEITWKMFDKAESRETYEYDVYFVYDVDGEMVCYILPVVEEDTSTGFTVEPYIADSAVSFGTEDAGEVWYFYSKDNSPVASYEFEEEWETGKCRGAKAVSAGKLSSFAVDEDAAASYPYLVLAFLPEDETNFCCPVILDTADES